MAQRTRRTLIVTNDFPPRQGGIQSFVHAMASRQPADELLVYASNFPGAPEFDAAQPFRVIRHGTGMLLPTPAASRAITAAARDFRATAVWFGAAAPLGLLAPALRRAGVEQLVATTHGHEVGWAKLPGARQMLRRIGRECDIVTYLGEYTRIRLAAAMGAEARLERLAPGVNTAVFTPDPQAGREVRAGLGLGSRPTIVCVSRLVPRKGQDALISALAGVRELVPDAALLIVGDGRYQQSLRELALREGVVDDVFFTGPVPHQQLPAHFAAGDVFAMPCRTRRHGLDVEGLGIVYLEASAMGLPVIAGDSGGAPDAVLDGSTGYLVDGRDQVAIVQRCAQLLQNRALAHSMGQAGRQWVVAEWEWEGAAATLREMLDR
ncbi:phosphatidylinositol alpha-1,6-mannosyltransferase [Jatrophihabitans sp. GAS493]|uniref:glycosyltransferase family 4 protein n=1 Tax=Jatrophihabitans sp. GAS493 TaxID=1907575 RepID=UPI000BBF672A|nr:glycosyltransferase family 4 protein [Jatrophihabitans sp. GAS493]SOD74381.1 phosphatidylinositol alpha-1,6-mannosyltransferase [Jatrophihabitans sp. GAS493]